MRTTIWLARTSKTARRIWRDNTERALAILNDHKLPASSWTDTGEYRGQIRRDAQKTLKQLNEKQG